MRDVLGVVLFLAVGGFLFVILVVPFLVVLWSIFAAVLGMD